MKERVHERAKESKQARWTRQERPRSEAYTVHAAVQAQYHVKGRSEPAEWMDLTQVQWMPYDRPPQQGMLICPLVRQSVEIWWPQDEKYYQGTVTAYLPERVRSAVNHAYMHFVWAPSHSVHASFAQRMPSGYVYGNKVPNMMPNSAALAVS